MVEREMLRNMETKDIYLEVEKAVIMHKENNVNYAIFPYGEIGHIVKEKLNSMGIQEIVLLDNFSKDPSVEHLSYLK
jgi:DUF1009 family protein